MVVKWESGFSLLSSLLAKLFRYEKMKSKILSCEFVKMIQVKVQVGGEEDFPQLLEFYYILNL